MISILIPHKSTPLNDISLELNKQMLKANTRSEYELIIMDEVEDPYVLWNRYVDLAKYNLIIFSNSDVLMAPDWDVNLIVNADNNSIITGYLVECGIKNLGVASQNIHKDFGKNPTFFNQVAFEQFCKEYVIEHRIPNIKNERGWYMPCLMTREFFIRMGRFPCEKPFPECNDFYFWERCIKNGVVLKQANSFAYHFQNLSNQIHDHERTT